MNPLIKKIIEDLLSNEPISAPVTPEMKVMVLKETIAFAEKIMALAEERIKKIQNANANMEAQLLGK
ncbi:hypothetical protein JW899_04385 [Candidatus Uhrbacteria bacterium]|nr:hypothetical protein [Candidatus Uhrbacteria bacterium]